MSREKQIEEMADILWHIPDNYNLNCYNDCERMTEEIYAAGYRKQSEGEWVEENPNIKTVIAKDFVGNETYDIPDYCSNCGFRSKDIGNYCSNCGAKMKGGAVG